jgi:uroporphyrinogen decarboxylase
MAKHMTSVERVNAFLERRDQDRIPRMDGYWPETIERWLSEGMAEGEHWKLLEPDFAHAGWSGPAPFPGQREILEEDDQTLVVLDRNGNTQRWWKNKSGTQEHIAFGCQDAESWYSTYKPALLESAGHQDTEKILAGYGKSREAGRWISFAGVECFEAMRQFVGDVCLLTAMLTEPEWVRDMSRTYTDLIIADHQRWWDAGVRADGVWVYGDVGYNPQPFFSPQTYRDTIWEDHARMAKWAHDKGLKFIYHTDGNVKPLIPLFIEAGFDALQPMEAKAGMDVRQLAPQYGDRLSFFGNIDMTVAITNDLEKVEAEVVSKLRAGMERKGYAYYSDHSVPPQVSWATYQHILRLVAEHGVYG